jgi:hypothetical protein
LDEHRNTEWHNLEIDLKKNTVMSQVPVTHACNPSCSGGRDQQDLGSKLLGPVVHETLPQKNKTKQNKKPQNKKQNKSQKKKHKREDLECLKL